MLDTVNVVVSVRTLLLLDKIHNKWRKERDMAPQDINFIISSLAEKELKGD